MLLDLCAIWLIVSLIYLMVQHEVVVHLMNVYCGNAPSVKQVLKTIL